MNYAETIRASEHSLDLIGEGDWTPQDSAHAKLTDAASELYAENRRLRAALAEILVEASAYHGGLNRKTNALASVVARAREALDGTPSEDGDA